MRRKVRARTWQAIRQMAGLVKVPAAANRREARPKQRKERSRSHRPKNTRQHKTHRQGTGDFLFPIPCFLSPDFSVVCSRTSMSAPRTELTQKQQDELVTAAKRAYENAYAPYS